MENHCRCELIQFYGRRLRISNTPIQMQRAYPHDFKSTSLYLISPKSIHIQNILMANIQKIQVNMYSIECRRCGSKFILLQNNNACFLLHIKNSTRHSRRQSDPVVYKPVDNKCTTLLDQYIVDSLKHFNETPFRPFQNDENLDEDLSQDNSDFDFMFSANRQLIIGSYRDSMDDSELSQSPIF